MKTRAINFEKIRNIRDLGGLENREGRLIAGGLLLRSANLAEATVADVEKLEKECRLARIVDLRTGMEKEQKPDAVIKSAEYLSIPIFDERVIGISHEKETRENQNSVYIPVMEELYCMMVTNETCRRNLGKAAQAVMEHDFSKGSVLWHCTEGKDRCGLLTAVLLSALSVERQQIMEDYMLTNEVNKAKADMYYQHAIAAGKSEMEAEAVKNAFLAKETYLNAAFAAIDEQYHDMETYLAEGLGIPESVTMAFRKKVLY